MAACSKECSYAKENFIGGMRGARDHSPALACPLKLDHFVGANKMIAYSANTLLNSIKQPSKTLTFAISSRP